MYLPVVLYYYMEVLKEKEEIRRTKHFRFPEDLSLPLFSSLFLFPTNYFLFSPWVFMHVVNNAFLQKIGTEKRENFLKEKAISF